MGNGMKPKQNDVDHVAALTATFLGAADREK
jgi:predicted regulator of Ras-like GTPase activity (Roadblock/LC7/MglB family)